MDQDKVEARQFICPAPICDVTRNYRHRCGALLESRRFVGSNFRSLANHWGKKHAAELGALKDFKQGSVTCEPCLSGSLSTIQEKDTLSKSADAIVESAMSHYGDMCVARHRFCTLFALCQP